METMFEATLDQAGRITIPDQVLSDLHLSPGSKIWVEENNGKITLEPIDNNDASEIIKKNGIDIIHAKLNGDMTKIIQQERNQRIVKIIGNQI